MEKLTKQQKEFIESKVDKIPDVLQNFKDIMNKDYFEDPYKQSGLLLCFLDIAKDLIEICHQVVIEERRQQLVYFSQSENSENSEL